MFRGLRVVLIIPALDEEEALPGVLSAVPDVVDRTVVADNGSLDRTLQVAQRCGAVVVRERRRGYGSACLTAIRESPDADVYVFLDGDGSDDPGEIPLLLARLVEEDLDLVVGSRVLGGADPGALTSVQLFGNRLTCLLVALLWRTRYTDLGPFRAITRAALERLEMRDPDFGWTIEMQVKATQRGLAVAEVPVRRRARQAGRSKVTGSLRGSFLAGKRILGYVFQAKLREVLGSTPGSANIPRRRTRAKTRRP